MDKEIEILRDLYSKESKHSNYQILSRRLSQIILEDKTQVKKKYEEERLKFILNNLDIKNKKILDIGGNTGYFTFELIDKDAKKVHYYEGNNIHSEFVRLASKILDVDSKLEITNQYYSFNRENYQNEYDIVLLLNVLHHIGDDYGDSTISLVDVRKSILKQLNNLAFISNYIVFQLGFNWKGNKEKGIFNNGTKAEMIDFLTEGTNKHWKIQHVGVAELIDNHCKYSYLNHNNIKRDDHLGEFLNRPIFIMKSLRCQNEVE